MNSNRVHTTTANGKKDLIYTLGEKNLGLIENNRTIHHALGDDRAIGSVWVENYPANSLGLPQAITRDLDEDIRDFEPNNHLLKIDSFEVKGSGKVGYIKLLSNVDTNLSKIDIDNNNSISSLAGGERKCVGVGFKIQYLFVYLLLTLLFFNREKYFNKG